MARHLADIGHRQLEGDARAVAEGDVVDGDEHVGVVREVLQQPRRAVEAAAQAAVGHAAQLGLALAVCLRLVEAVLEEEAERAARHHEQRAQCKRARRVAHLRNG